MIPEEMHDKIIQDQMRNANDEKKKASKRSERLPMWGVTCGWK
jgi:hypothetical protein